MRNRSLAAVGLLSLPLLVFIACGGSSDGPSQFDSGANTKTTNGVPDATTNGNGNGGGDDDGSAGLQLGDASSTTGNDGATIDCDATPIACMKEVCGDGVIEPGETCDDKNTVSGDGCSSTCQVEANYWACVPGEACIDTRNCNQLEEAGVLVDAGPDSGCFAPPKAAVCGDGVRDPGEACDTGPTVGQPTSGCSVDCKTISAGYSCPPAGGACTNTWICGDGKVEGAEHCDDGNMSSGDGCSYPACQVEPGYKCTLAGIACSAASCGDGIVAKPETCDTGDAGSPACVNCMLASVVTVTDGGVTYSTRPGTGGTPGVNGGDAGGVIATNSNGTPKVSPPTTTTVNYVCDGGVANVADAGDGGDAGDAAVTVTPDTCTVAVCGNNKLEGSEQCDDGNTKNYDGCSTTCQLEPSCPNGVCVAVCGDGLVFNFDTNGDGKPDEQCDDGNAVSGDGCSSTCQTEVGYTCTISKQANPPFVDVPVVYHDMLYSSLGDIPTTGTYAPYAHPDFEYYSGSVATPDLTLPTLVNGVPVFQWDGYHDPNSMPPGTADFIDPVTGLPNPNGASQQLTSAPDFTDWYADVIASDTTGLTMPRGIRIDGQSIRMVLKPSGSYVFDSECDAPFGAGYDASGTCICAPGLAPNADGTCTFKTAVTTGNAKHNVGDPAYGGIGGFFPIDTLGWEKLTSQYSADQYNYFQHNFSFTTQFRYYFTYDASQQPVLDFSGDDDVWVFLANKRALDLGGLHPRNEQSFTLTSALAKTLGLVDGHVYEVDLFNAERHQNGSNFKLTLTGFTKEVSTCTPICGDGIRTSTEQCDNGAMNSGTVAAGNVPYNGCSINCTIGPYCGDDVQQNPPELCDDGVNSTPYAASSMSNACAPGCTKPAYCGDGVLQASFGEYCDNGAMNSGTGPAGNVPYDGCSTTCTPGPRCGDAVVQTNDGEQCDNGYNSTPYERTLNAGDCAPGCKLPTYCGDGRVDVPYEICDNGSANSATNAYGSCTTGCVLGPHCGDGIVQNPPETCDDGNLVNGDGCSADCQKEGGIR